MTLDAAERQRLRELCSKISTGSWHSCGYVPMSQIDALAIRDAVNALPAALDMIDALETELVENWASMNENLRNALKEAEFLRMAVIDYAHGTAA